MLCSKCHKNEAVICYTEIVDGVRREQYLCSECAARYTAFDTSGMGISPGNLLAGLLTSVLAKAGLPREDDAKKTNLVCKSCGMTYNEFLKYSKFGCPECVHTFGFLLDDYLKKIQGSCEHTGKRYGKAETVAVPQIFSFDESREEISAEPEGEVLGVDLLKKQLKAAILAEEYEEAARLRDLIKAADAAMKGDQS